MTSKQLRERLAKKIAESRAIIDKADEEKRDRTAEENEQIARIHADAAELQAQIETAERQERFENSMGQFRSTDPDMDRRAVGGDGAALATIDRERSLAFSGWALNQYGLQECVTDEHRQAMNRFGIDASHDQITVRLPSFYHSPIGVRRADQILNALSVGSSTAGSYLVPEGFVRALEVALLQFGGMRQVSTLIRTSTGEPLPYPTVDDTSNTGQILSENALESTAGTDVAFGSIVFNAYMYTSRFVRVSKVLLRDSAFDIPSLLGRLLGERLGRIQNTDLTTGTGNAKPKGIVTAATLGRTTASATAITADDFIRLIHSVDPAYRGSPGVSFMMHDSIFLEASLLKDGNNNYLIRPTVDATFTGATPYRIRGFNIVTNQSMASSLAASNKVTLFGDFSKYIIREVGSMEVTRLVERFAEYFQEGFIASLSFDGNLLDAGTNPVKYLQMAAA